MLRTTTALAAALTISLPGLALAQASLTPEGALLICKDDLTAPPCASGAAPEPLLPRDLLDLTQDEIVRIARDNGLRPRELREAARAGRELRQAERAPDADTSVPGDGAGISEETTAESQTPPAQDAEVEALGQALEESAGVDAREGVAEQIAAEAAEPAAEQTEEIAQALEEATREVEAPAPAPAARAEFQADGTILVCPDLTLPPCADAAPRSFRLQEYRDLSRAQRQDLAALYGITEDELQAAARAANRAARIESVPQEDTETTAEIANETPDVAATEEASAEAEVETVTVGEDTARSSSEEVDEDDDTFEKLLLGGLGALAIGQILSSGEQVVERSAGRAVVERDGELRVIKDDDATLRRAGAEVTTRTFDDGSTLTRVIGPDGGEVVTVRAPDGRVLRRTRYLPSGEEVVLFDDTREIAPVNVEDIARLRQRDAAGADSLGDALERDYALERAYSLQQIRQVRAVRDLMPAIELAAINFDTGSAAIRRTEAAELTDIGRAMASLIDLNPDEVFLIEGHTDAVGSATYNLALSDRRAESVALALTEYFGVPPENMIAQGYGESDLAVQTEGASRENRRATVRRITPLLRGASLN